MAGRPLARAQTGRGLGRWQPQSFVTLVLMLGAWLISGVPVAAQIQPRSSAWSDVDCRAFKVTPAAGVTCGYVRAPLHHAQPNGPSLQLAVVVIPALGADVQPDPLFMAQGGPGGSTIDTFASALIDTPAERPAQNRDVVLWDQRGTLYSKPALLCPEVTAEGVREAMADAPSPDETTSDGTQACGELLAALAGDLSAFNSVENAADVEDVRAALGYDQINFYGVSYGTELGQLVMRQQPQHLRSVILDAVVPLTYNIYTEPAFAKQRIGQMYFDGCAADPRCNAAFPDLGQRYLALIDRLNETPVTVPVTPTDSEALPAEVPLPTVDQNRSLLDVLAGTPYQIKLTGTLFESTLYQALYADTYTLIPLVVDRADRGDFTFLSSFFLPLALFDTTEATGMWYTVTCAERGDTDPAAADYSQLVPRLADAERADAESVLQVCHQWQIPLLPRGVLAPLHSSLPTLLLSGAYDPITPPEYAETLLPDLPNAQHVVFPYGSHGQAVTNACANGLMQAFLDTPTATLNGTCATTQRAAFRTDQDVITLPPLRAALQANGLSGLLTAAVTTIPTLLSGLVLTTAVPVYALGWLVQRLRSRRADAARPDWTAGWSGAAPWLAVGAAVVVVIFTLGLGDALLDTIVANDMVIGLGAVPATYRWLFYLPPLFLALVMGMVAAMVALWVGRRRSIVGRIYYTVLVLAGLATLSGLFSLGVMDLWRA